MKNHLRATPQQIPLNQQHAAIYDDDLTGRVPTSA